MKKVFICVLVVLTLILTACGSEKSEPEIEPIQAGYIQMYVDEKTGVNYLIFKGINEGGMSPRYNADGSLYITPNDVNTGEGINNNAGSNIAEAGN